MYTVGKSVRRHFSSLIVATGCYIRLMRLDRSCFPANIQVETVSNGLLLFFSVIQ